MHPVIAPSAPAAALHTFDFDLTMQAVRVAAHAPERATQQDWDRLIGALLIHRDAPRRHEVLDYAAALLGSKEGRTRLATAMLAPYFRVDDKGAADQIRTNRPPTFKRAQVVLYKHSTSFADSADHFATLLEYDLPLEDAQRIAHAAMWQHIVSHDGYSWDAEFLRKQMDEMPLQWAKERISASIVHWMRMEREMGRLQGSVAWEIMSNRADATSLHSVMIMALVEVLDKLLKNK